MRVCCAYVRVFVCVHVHACVRLASRQFTRKKGSSSSDQYTRLLVRGTGEPDDEALMGLPSDKLARMVLAVKTRKGRLPQPPTASLVPPPPPPPPEALRSAE